MDGTDPSLAADNTVRFAARLTPAGRGAVAVLGVSGGGLPTHRSPFRAANGRPWNEQPLHQLVYGDWEGEAVVVCRLADDAWEVQCHGGDTAVERILRTLVTLGFVTVDAAEFRATRHGRLDAEWHAALSSAWTARTADWLLTQAPECWREWLARPRELAWWDASLATATFGRHLTEPWSVVLTGRPNVGKSSLINALLGFERALVSPLPGTTRDVVQALTAFEGWPVRLSDTAGQRRTHEALEQAGIDLARTELAAADLVVVLLDLSAPPTEADRGLLAEWPTAVVVGHKADLLDLWGPTLPADALRVSSRTGEGLEALQRTIIARLIPQEPADDLLIPYTDRQQTLLRQLREALHANNRPHYDALLATLW
jgi:tRNA modification GTPase